jgi:hypothetical protein
MKKQFPWFGAAVVLIIIFGTMYGVVQQAQRHAANSPQIQIAEDTAAALNKGTKPAALAAGKVSLNASLAPFTIIYDKSGRIVAGNGYLDGRVPSVPYGVLRAANNQAYHFVTWQPQDGVRIAAVTVVADNYYALSGRSLKEVEANENVTFQFVLLGGIASLVVIGTSWALSRKVVPNRVLH